jgi:hypothetical protein
MRIKGDKFNIKCLTFINFLLENNIIDKRDFYKYFLGRKWDKVLKSLKIKGVRERRKASSPVRVWNNE